MGNIKKQGGVGGTYCSSVGRMRGEIGGPGVIDGFTSWRGGSGLAKRGAKQPNENRKVGGNRKREPSRKEKPLEV